MDDIGLNYKNMRASVMTKFFNNTVISKPYSYRTAKCVT